MTPDDALERLIAAHLAVNLAVRPDLARRRRASDVPQSIHTIAERMDWERAAYERAKLEGEIDAKGMRIKPRLIGGGRPAPPSAHEMSEAEEAAGWLALIADDRERFAVLTFVIFSASGRQGFPQALNRRLRRFGPGVSEATAYRLKDRGLDAICGAVAAKKFHFPS